MKSSFEQNGGTYRQVGDYLIPNLALSPEESNIKLGKWGWTHRDYLKNHKTVVFATLLSRGKLWQYLADIDQQAQEMFFQLIAQMAECEGVTEQLKEENQTEWVAQMSSIEVHAREIVNSELIYVWASLLGNSFYNSLPWLLRKSISYFIGVEKRKSYVAHCRFVTVITVNCKVILTQKKVNGITIKYGQKRPPSQTSRRSDSFTEYIVYHWLIVI